ncbi:hypothetical protein VFA_004352 [Vibrio furnissii CIP 102972]|nr:hypothetical protein VFA_004352 [Vibrio furnissii CIP 102972]
MQKGWRDGQPFFSFYRGEVNYAYAQRSRMISWLTSLTVW